MLFSEIWNFKSVLSLTKVISHLFFCIVLNRKFKNSLGKGSPRGRCSIHKGIFDFEHFYGWVHSVNSLLIGRNSKTADRRMKRTKTFAFGAYETKYETKAFGAYEYECEYFKPRKCQGHFGAIWCTFSELKKQIQFGPLGIWVINMSILTSNMARCTWSTLIKRLRNELWKVEAIQWETGTH